MADLFDIAAQQYKGKRSAPAAPPPPAKTGDLFDVAALEYQKSAPSAEPSFMDTAARYTGLPKPVRDLASGVLKGATVDLVKGAYDTLTSPIETAKRLWNKSEENQAKAVEAFKAGDVMTGIGNTLYGTYMFGPMVQGITEGLVLGDTEEKGRAIGQMLAPAVAGRAVKGAGSAVRGAKQYISERLQQGAVKSYEKALGPTPKMQEDLRPGVAERLAKERFRAATSEGLRKKIDARVDTVAKALDEEWAKLPDDMLVDAGKVMDHMRQVTEARHMIQDAAGRMVPKAEQGSTVRLVDRLARELDSFAEDMPITGDGGVVTTLRVIPARKLRQVRQMWDQAAADAGRFRNDPKMTPKVKGYGLAGDAVRNELAKDFPNIDAINKEFSFVKSAQDAIHEALDYRATHPGTLGKLATGVAGAAIGSSGGPMSSMMGAAGLTALRSAVNSPGWRTISGSLKMQLADALTQQQGARALVITKMIESSLRNSGRLAPVAGVNKKQDDINEVLR